MGKSKRSAGVRAARWGSRVRGREGRRRSELAGRKRHDSGADFLDQARRNLERQHLPHVLACLHALSDQAIWWRPNSASNSVGNLVLHLAGNVRQWIVAGMGGARDVRHRDKEFSEQGPLPGSGLAALLRGTVNEAGGVLARTRPDSLGLPCEVQGFRLTRLQAIERVLEHFAMHTGQIVYVTKLKTGRDLRFTRLPGPKPARRAKSRRR